MSNFCHLHLHSQYSVLDGANKIKDVVKKAFSLGQTSVGITDHGVMHGAIEFYQAAKDIGIKPIIGCEVYLAAQGRFIKKDGQRDTNHLTLLAASREGYQNLCKLVSLGYFEGFYFKPRIDHEILARFNKGIICFSGCLAGELAEYTLKGDFKGAREIAIKYASYFKDRYYLEVQPHNIPEQRAHNEMVKELASSLGLPLIATNDCHYLNKDDHHAQEVLMCISTGKLITDPTRIKHDGLELYLKSKDEMIISLPGYNEAIDQSGVVADMCNLDFDFNNYYMPKYEAIKESEKGLSLEELFRKESEEGLDFRFAEDGINDEALVKSYKERLQMELKCIMDMGFGGYFLVVSDFIKWSKENNIPVGPGRGSAAGSLVAYALRITEIDPIKYLLLFERFLNPDRVSLPDIDVDFCITGRSKVIDYVCERYGKDKVSHILTFGTLKAKQAIKDVGRVLGLSYAEMDRVAKLVPAPRQGFDYPLTEALQMEKKLQEYADGEGKEVIELALKLEGLSRHTSTHAAGIVIADKPIVEYLPLMEDKDGQVVTQYSMSWVEKIGLVKFDFLGLKTLSVIDLAQTLIDKEKNYKGGKHWLNINSIPLDDEKVFKLISSARTIGIFQLESSGITEMVSRLRPSCFEDLVAILALYRPGPLDAGMVDHYINRKHKREPVVYLYPVLEPILKDTYGIILYQEQIMQIARDLAGYSLAEADMLRRAMGKKKPEEMAKQREFFLSGAAKRKVPDNISSQVFDQMETFARYGFNRSHSVAYAMISYQTAYLKTHFPRQFLAALMTYEMSDTDRTLKNLNECREMKISVLPPDVNSGGVGFSVHKQDIIYGLAAIKGVGEKVVERVIAERESAGLFKGVLDFAIRLKDSGVNRRMLESLIKAGAFDWTGTSRKDLHDNVEEVIKISDRVFQSKTSKQRGLFEEDNNFEADDSVFVPKIGNSEWPTNIKLLKEREALGFYLSGHPLERYSQDLKRLKILTTSELKEKKSDSVVLSAGVVTFLKLKNTKKGDRYATFLLEDLFGTVEVLVWPDTYREVHELIHTDEPILIKARLDVSDERVVVIAQEVSPLSKIRNDNVKEVLINLFEDSINKESLENLKSTLVKFEGGNCPVKISIKRNRHSEVIMSLSDNMKVSVSDELYYAVEKLFGENVLTFK